MRHLAPMFCLASTLLLAACSAPATQNATVATNADLAQATTSSNEAPKKGLDPNRIVCKKVAPTGSRLAKKTCTTAAEWQRMAEDGRAAVEETQRMGVQSGIEQE